MTTACVWRFVMAGITGDSVVYTFASKEEYQEALDIARTIASELGDWSVEDIGADFATLDTLASFREAWAEEIAAAAGLEDGGENEGGNWDAEVDGVS